MPKSATLAAAGDSSNLRKLSHDYAAEHLHLGYASTVCCSQGETTNISLVGPDACGLYVGLTRGRRDNTALVIAGSDASVRTQLVNAMQRHPIEETTEKNRAAAKAEFARAVVVAPTPAAPRACRP